MNPSQAWFLAWRALVLLLQSLAPWAAPLDVPRPAGDAAMVQLLVGWLGLTLLVVVCVRALERARLRSLVAALALLTVIAAGVTGYALPRGDLPLGYGVRWMGPLVWLTLLAALRRFAPASWKNSASLGWVMLAVVTAALSFARLRTPESMWRSVVARRPDHAEAQVTLARIVGRGPDGAAKALAVLDRCVRQSPRSRPCWTARAQLRVDAGEHGPAALDAQRALALDDDDAASAVLRAVALTRVQPVPPEAEASARRALELAPDDPRASLALAMALDAKGDAEGARAALGRAIARAPTLDARLLETTLALRQGDVPGARRAVQAALALAPDDPRATYNLGVVAQREGRYNEAREAYLKTLRREARHYAARYNLAVLTKDAGATGEARHHLEALLRAYPGDRAAVQLLARLEHVDQAPAAPGGAAPR
ncbi:MAG: tetratricopeptide repeat protein [Myxococcales bacterium]|nr:tetratricopeptide repeat protein [Myxococcales bacterium]